MVSRSSGPDLGFPQGLEFVVPEGQPGCFGLGQGCAS